MTSLSRFVVYLLIHLGWGIQTPQISCQHKTYKLSFPLVVFVGSSRFLFFFRFFPIPLSGFLLFPRAAFYLATPVRNGVLVLTITKEQNLSLDKMKQYSPFMENDLRQDVELIGS